MNIATYHFVCYLYLLYGLFLLVKALSGRGKEESIIRKRRKEMVPENC